LINSHATKRNKYGPNNGKAAIDDIKESGIIEKCPANKKLCKGFVE